MNFVLFDDKETKKPQTKEARKRWWQKTGGGTFGGDVRTFSATEWGRPLVRGSILSSNTTWCCCYFHYCHISHEQLDKGFLIRNWILQCCKSQYQYKRRPLGSLSSPNDVSDTRTTTTTPSRFGYDARCRTIQSRRRSSGRFPDIGGNLRE